MKLTELLLDVQAATEEAKSGLRGVAADLQQFAGNEADAKMDIKGLTKVLADLKAADEALKRFGEEEATAKVRVQVIGPTRSQLSDIINEAQSTLGSGLARSPGGSSSYGGESGLRAFLRDVQSLESVGRDAELVAKDIGTEIEDVGNKASKAGGSGGGGFGDLEMSISRIQPMLAGIGVVLLVTLAPALLALAASAAQAVVALGALAAAAAGLMLPAGFAMIAMMTSLADVMAAVTAGLKQSDAAMAGNESATKQSTAAQDAAAQSAQSLKQARDQLSESEAAYAQTVDDARQKIADAAQAEQKDTIALADAQQKLRDETVAAYQAWQDAIEKVKQDLFALQDAQIGVEQSHLDLATAVNKLKADMQAAGAVSTQYLDLFKRIQDVNLSNLNVGQLTREIAAVPTGATGATDTTLRQDLLDIVKARLAEQEATDKVATSQVQLNRDRATELQFAREGIDAYRPYRDAVRSVLDAQDTLNKATEAYNKLLSQGVYGQSAVVSAERAVENAHYALANAQRAVGKAALEVAQNVGTEQNAFQAAMAILDPAEQQLVHTIIDLVHWFEDITRPFVDSVVGIANGWIKAMEGEVKAHMGVVQGFLSTLADNIRAIAGSLLSPQWEAFWTQMFQGATAIVPILSRALLDLLNIFREIASASLPYLMTVLNQVVGWIDKVASALGRGHTAADLVQQVMHSLGVWLQLAADAAHVLIDVMLALGPIGDQMVAWVDRALRGIIAFLETPKGRKELQDFVKEFVPVIEWLVLVVAKLAIGFLYLLKVAAPALVPALKVIGLILDILIAVLSLVGKIPRPILTVIGYIAAIGGAAWGTKIAWDLMRKFAIDAFEKIAAFIWMKLIPAIDDIGAALGRWLPKIGTWAESALGGIARAGRWLLEFLGKPIEWIGNVIRALVIPAIEFIGEAVVGLAAIVGAPVEVVVAAIAAIIAVTVLVVTHWKEVKSALSDIWSWMKQAAKDTADFISGTFWAAVNIVKGAINWVIGQINDFINGWNSTPLGKGIDTPLGHIGGIHIPLIPKLAEGGIATRAMLGLFGEAGPEAVVPLKADVLAHLGQSIVAAMGEHPHQAPKAGPGQLVQHNDFHITAPAGTNPDPEFALSRIAAGMRRRGLGLVGMAT